MRVFVLAVSALPLVSSFAPVPALSQERSGHTTHVEGARDTQVLREPGQGAFAALSEVLARLEGDPDADWSSVTIGALRDHLVDMNRLVMATRAEETWLPNGLSIRITAEGEAMEALRRMVPAHAAELAGDTRWRISATDGAGEVRLVATSEDPRIVAKIRALGFYGLMASQDHHREHHWSIARGSGHH